MLKKEIPVLISVRNCLFCDEIAGTQKGNQLCGEKARTSGNHDFKITKALIFLKAL